MSGSLKDLDIFDWAYALAESAVQGACGTLAVMFVDPSEFNFGQWHKLLALAAGGALIAIVNKLRQSPLPPKHGMSATISIGTT